MSAAGLTEYTIRCPKNTNKKLQVMRFASERDLDFKKWTNVKMERENNMREFKGMDEDQPKYGAGSEFGRDQREEARRKKLGIVSRKYKSEDQPWLLKVGGKTGKKYKGIRDGGISDNAAYYIFTHAQDGHIDAYPLQEWYNFTATQRFKTLSAEEAEDFYSKRNKTIDYFNLMMRKRLRGEADDADDEAKEEKKKGKKKKDFTISELDEWMNSSDDEESGEEEKDEEEKDKKKKQNLKDKKGKKKKKKKGSDDEAFEESDDGDEEGREHEYISDSSSSESEHGETKQLKGVAEEDALRKLLTSDEDSDEEKKDEDEKKEEDEKTEEGEQAAKPAKKSKKKAATAAVKQESKENSSSELSSDSSDDEKKKALPEEEKPSTSQAAPEKRKASDTPPSSPPLKKARPEGSGDSMEDAVRRYLARKPMTTTELLQKFKSKKTGMSSEQLLKLMTQILKRINPVRQTIKGKMYLSIKK